MENKRMEQSQSYSNGRTREGAKGDIQLRGTMGELAIGSSELLLVSMIANVSSPRQMLLPSFLDHHMRWASFVLMLDPPSQTIFAMAWCNRPGDRYKFRMAIGSFVEEYSNKVQVRRQTLPRVIGSTLNACLSTPCLISAHPTTTRRPIRNDRRTGSSLSRDESNVGACAAPRPERPDCNCWRLPARVEYI